MNGLSHSTLPVQCGNRSIRTIITTSDDGKVLECSPLCESMFDYQQTALMDDPPYVLRVARTRKYCFDARQ